MYILHMYLELIICVYCLDYELFGSLKFAIMWFLLLLYTTVSLQLTFQIGELLKFTMPQQVRFNYVEMKMRIVFCHSVV